MSSLSAKIAALAAAAQLLTTAEAPAQTNFAPAPGKEPVPAADSRLPGPWRDFAPAPGSPDLFGGLIPRFPAITDAPPSALPLKPPPAEEKSYLPDSGIPTVQQLSDAIAFGPPSDYAQATELLKPEHLRSQKLLDALMNRAKTAPADLDLLVVMPPEVVTDKRLEPFVLTALERKTNALPILPDDRLEFTPRIEERWFAKALRLLDGAEKAGDKAARSDLLSSLTAGMAGRPEMAPYIERSIRDNPFAVCTTVRPFWTEARRPLLLESVRKVTEKGGYISLQSCIERGTLDFPEVQKFLATLITADRNVFPLLTADTLRDPHTRELITQALRTDSEIWTHVPASLAGDAGFRIEYLRALHQPKGPENFERCSSGWSPDFFNERMLQIPTMYGALLSRHDRGDALPRAEQLPQIIMINPRMFSQAVALENVSDPAALGAYAKMVQAYDLLRIDNFNHCDNGREIIRQRYGVADPAMRTQLEQILGKEYFTGVDQDRRPIANCFVSKADHNGAIENDSIRQNLNELCSGYRVRLFQITNKADLAEAIRIASRDGTEKAPVTFVSGHGSPDKVTLGRRYWSPVFLSTGDRDSFEIFKMAVAEGSILIARACDTGAAIPQAQSGTTNAPAKAMNMAESWHAALPGVRIYAPKLTISDVLLRFDSFGTVTGCSFQLDGKEIDSALFSK